MDITKVFFLSRFSAKRRKCFFCIQKILTVLVNFIPPPPLENIWRLYGRVSFPSFFSLYEIRKKQNFVILCGIYLLWYVHFFFAFIFTLSILPWYIHFLNEDDIEKWSSERLFTAASKKFLRTGKSKYFSRWWEIKLTSTVIQNCW